MGASMMVMVGILTPAESYASIDTGTLLLLLGLMMILGILESKGIVRTFVKVLMYGSVTPLGLLARVSMLSGIISAFIMNDGAALILSVVVVKICNKFTLPLAPYMMAMATSANIGSAATPLGNPKNMVVHSEAGISFVDFVRKMGLPALAGLVLNTLLITLYFRNQLGSSKFSKDPALSEDDSDNEDDAEDDETAEMNKEFAMMQKVSSMASTAINEDTPLMNRQTSFEPMQNRWMAKVTEVQLKTYQDIIDEDPDAKDIYDDVRKTGPQASSPVVDPGPALELASKFGYPVDPQVLAELDEDIKTETEQERKSVRGGAQPSHFADSLHTSAIAIVIVMMYVGFVLNFPLGWTTMAAAILLIVLERSAEGVYDIDWQILIYIIGMFVVITGVNKSPFTKVSWNVVKPLVTSKNPLISVGGFCLLVIVLSFIFTSIPTVLLVSPHLNSLEGPMQPYAWLLLAWSVTLCGNLTIFGSVAGVIASQKAEAAGESISFMTWFKFAFPATLLILGVGACILVTV
eukprot:CAMPEP_0167783790 /NCGR_PEP_ID=MMETSP0111_2-20121227/7267_1 /TAXON_ID=91324 /ORGANISM="Lotharella globosa, Strain CCCM811" /LENGTH=519 /DNA_ID=CAMNT_0007674769 /DNA_START=149 /DNA_END=1708 /DNA_ORIENTATION=+